MSWNKTPWYDVIGADATKQTVLPQSLTTGSIDCNGPVPYKFLSVAIKVVIDFTNNPNSSVVINVYGIDARGANEADTIPMYTQEITAVASSSQIITIPNLETSALDSLIVEVKNNDSASNISTWVSFIGAYNDSYVGSGPDEKVKISYNDTTSDFLTTKLVGTPGKIILTEINDGGNEQLQIDIGAVSAGGGNIISRYAVVSGVGQGVWLTSSSVLFSSLSWSRTNTSLIITHPAHGRSIGDRVLIKDINVNYINAIIAGITVDTFTITCDNSGSTSGSNASYTVGFTFVYNDVPGSITDGTVIAPTNVNVLLLSMRVHLAANTRLSTTFDIIVPSSALNGAGQNTNNDDLYWPVFSVRQDGDNMAGVSATIAKNVLGNFSRFRFSALSAVVVGQMFALTW